jgi:hypothetical protein
MNEKKVRSIITDPDHLPGWLSCPEGVFLREHAENATLSDVVEIGTFYGRSTSFILEGLRKRFGEKMFRVWTVDPWNWKDPHILDVHAVKRLPQECSTSYYNIRICSTNYTA